MRSCARTDITIHAVVESAVSMRGVGITCAFDKGLRWHCSSRSVEVWSSVAGSVFTAVAVASEGSVYWPSLAPALP